MKFKEMNKEVYERLNTEQKALDRDLAAFEILVDKMPNETAAVHTKDEMIYKPGGVQRREKTPLRKISQVQQHHQIPIEVLEFEEYIGSNGGLLGGWDDVDHAQFMRLRSKFRGNRELFLSEAARLIPGQTIISIQQHEEFYRKYLALNKRKRQAIQNWREEKERQKEILIEQMEEETQALQQTEEEEEERAKQLELEKRLRREQLQQWKEERARKLEIEMRLKQEKEEEEQAQREKEEQRRREEVKLKLDNYRRKKEKEKNEEQKRTIEEKKKKRRPPSRNDLERLQRRDQAFLDRRRQLQYAKEIEDIERKERLDRLASQVHVEVERDFSRLTKGTSAHNNRVTARIVSGAETDPSKLNFNILKAQQRIIPSWRK